MNRFARTSAVSQLYKATQLTYLSHISFKEGLHTLTIAIGILFMGFNLNSQCTFVTNGTFDTDLNGWTANSSVIQNNGRAVFSFDTSPTDGVLTQSLSLVECNVYEMTVEISQFGNNQQVEIYIDGVSQGIFMPSTPTFVFTAQQSNVEIRFEDRSADSTQGNLRVDNVEVCLIEDNVASNDPVLEVTLTDPLSLESCGNSAILSVSMEYTSAYPDQDLSNIIGTLDLPSGITVIDVVNFNGGNGAYMAPDEIIIDDMSPGDILTYDIEVDAGCNIPDPFTYLIDFAYDPVCPGADVTTVATSGDISVLSPNITISASTPPFFNGQIGYEQMITNTVSNTGNLDAGDGDLTYCIIDFTNGDLTDITVSGITLLPAPNSPAGQTCYVIPGTLVVGGSIDVVETWVITSCDPSEDEIMRRASYGCDGEIDCQDLPQGQFPSTEITYNVPDPVLAIDVDFITNLAICSEPETATVTVDYINIQDVDLTGVTAEIILPPNLNVTSVNSISGGTVTPTSSDNTSIDITDMEEGSTLIFELDIQSGCVDAGTNQSFDVVISYDDLCEDVTSEASQSTNTFVIQSASLSLISSAIQGNLQESMNVFDAILGMADTLKVPLTNAGNGAVTEMEYFVINPPSLEIQDVLIAGMSLPIARTSGDTVFYSIDMSLIMNSTLAGVVGDGDGLFEQNEILTVCEVWLGTECQFGQLEPIMRGATFGCYGGVCGTSNISSSGISFDFASPDLSISAYAPYTYRPACYDSENTVYGFEIINNGMSPAKDIILELNQEFYDGALVGSSIEYSIGDPNGPFTPATIGANNPNTNRPCVNAISDNYDSFNAEMLNVFLGAGETLYFRYEIDHACNCRSCDILYVYGNNLRSIAWTDPCDLDFSDQDDINRPRFNARYFGFIEGESDTGVSGGCTRYAVTDAQNSWLANSNRAEFPNAYLEVVLTSQCGMDIDASSIQWVDADGTAFTPSIITDIDNGPNGDDEIIVRFGDTPGNVYPSGFSASGDTALEFCYQPDCSEKPNGGCSQISNFTVSPFFVTDPSCTSCRANLDCPTPFPITYDCPGCGPCDGIIHTNLQIDRVTYGLVDSDNNNEPDGGIVTDPTTIKTNRFLTGDTMKVTFEGLVNDDDMSEIWDIAFATIDITTTDFSILGGELEVYDASNNNALLSCDVLSQFPDGTKMVTDISSGVLNMLGCSDFDGFEYQDGDSIRLCVFYTSKDELINIDSRALTHNSWFYLSDDTYALGDTFRCNLLLENTQQIGIRNYHNDVISGRNFGGCDLSNFYLRSDLNYGALSFDEFPNEIRSLGTPDEIYFTKPSDFQFRNDQHRLLFTQYIGPNRSPANTSLTIPQQFFVENGDQLVFLIGDYLASLNSPLLPLDEGGIFWFYPKIQGDCRTEAGTYQGTFEAIYEVNEQVFCSPTFEVAPTTENFNYTGGPILEITTPLSVNELTEPMACVTLNLRNFTNLDAPFSFINLDVPTGGLVVTSLTEITNGASDLITPTPFGIYPLGTTSSSSRQFELCVNVTDCDPQTMQFSAGWDCVDYPTTVFEATCSDPSDLSFITLSGDLDGELLQPANDISVMLCDTVDFLFRMASTQIGNIKDVEFEFTLPNNLNYVPGSYELAYPVPFAGGDTLFVHHEDPFNIYGTTLIDTVSEHYPQLDSFGLIGSPGALDNTNIILARFKTVSDCGYASGSLPTFKTRAVDACTNPTATVSAPGAKVIINNALPEYEINVDIGELTLNPCQDDAATIEIDMEILADPGVFTQNSDSISITLPPGLEYVVGSYDAISNADGSTPVLEDVNGQTILKMPLQGGLGNGDIVNFEFDIMAVDIGQLCEIYEILVQTLSVRAENCGSMTCDIKVISGSKSTPVSIQKPDLKIDVVSLAFETAPPGQLTYTIDVTNEGAVPQLAGDPINIELYNDADANGFLDPSIDNLVTTIPEGVSILPGETITLMGGIALPPDGLCTVLAQISSETTCTCSTDVSNQTSVEIINDFDKELTVCSGSTINIGPAAIGGYDYEWVPIGSANITALSSSTTTPVDFSFDNTSGSNIEWQYALRSSFSSCFSYDTLSVTLYPDNDQRVNPQACEGLPFTIPGPSMGTDFSWTPTTQLDDPNSMFPTLSAVPAGTTTYLLDYIDDNGCATTHEVNITAITCAPNTAIGDIVWFDLNENGRQDVGEPGIPGVTVFLYNSTNPVPGNQIGVTMTDSNGNYIFENIPSGNYVVGFDFPSGFVPTTTDSAGDDTLDSDADRGSGLTGAYFIPNGMANLTVDAGFIPDCTLEVEIAEIGECSFLDPGHERLVTLDVNWSGAVYTNAFLGGTDTIEINILGQVLKIGIDEVDGNDSITFSMPGGTADQDLIATAAFQLDPDCVATDEVLAVSACIYDVALIKTLPAGFTPEYNSTVPYTITVENQGAQSVNNVKVTDLLPIGFAFDAADNPGWMESSPGVLMYTITDVLDPSESLDIPLNVTLLMSSDPDAYLNIAEITAFTDILDVDRSDQDRDSTPDADFTNDAGGLVDSGSDNSLNGDGSGSPGDNNPNTDEDDSDPELLEIVDLALMKNIITPGPYSFGQTVIFEIEIFNQGNVDVQNVVVNDNLPAGFLFANTNDPLVWSHTGGIATTTLAGPIAALSSTTVQIEAIIQMAGSSQYVNVAEIQSFENLDGSSIALRDLDSTADNIPDNDGGGVPNGQSDGAINGDGTGASGDDSAVTDEDDMDIAFISIPLLEIDKTTTAIEEARSGVVGNFDVTFAIEMVNEGTTKLNNIKLQDDLVEQIGGTFIGIVIPPEIVQSTATMDPTVNPGYNGAVIDSIFTGIDGCLAVDEAITVEFTIEVSALSGADVNEAIGMAVDSLGVMVMDQDTALIMVPTCFLAVECPLIDQGTYSCITEIPDAATDLESFNAIDSAADIDNFCNEPVITVAESMSGTGCAGDPLVVTRVYTITDSGDDPIGEQVETCTVEYTVIDSDKPIIMVTPSDLILECGDGGNANAISNWIAMQGGAVAVEGCSSLTWSDTAASPSDECGQTSTTTHSFTAVDQCGNSITVTANVVIVDTTPPQLRLPTEDNFVDCSVAGTAALEAWIDSAEARDACGEVTITTALISSEQVCVGTRYRYDTYEFTAVDECGNTTFDRAAFTVTDVTDPIIIAPDDLILDCGDDVSASLLAWLQDYTVTEVCQSTTVTNTYDGSVPDLCGGSQNIIWTVTDECGVTGTASADIIINDDTAGPTLTCIPEYTFAVDVDDCGSNVTVPLPIATDCNGVASIVQTSPAPNTEYPIGTTTVTFTAVDNCGNASTCTSQVTIVDTQNPDLVCPPSINVCNDTGTCTWASDASVNPLTADCGSTTLSYTVTNPDGSITTPSVIEGYLFSVGSSIVTITATDDATATNMATCNFTVNVEDCEAPNLTCPDDLVIECGDGATPPGPVATGQLVWNHNGGNPSGTSYAGDNNSNGIVSSAEDISFGDGLTLLDDSNNPAMIPNGSTFEHILTDAQTNNLTDAIADADYAELCFTTAQKSSITNIQQGLISAGSGGSGAGNFLVSTAISSDGFGTSTSIFTDVLVPDPNATGYGAYSEATNVDLVAGTEYCIRFYLYNEQNSYNPNNTVAFDDVFINLEECPVDPDLASFLSGFTVSDNCPNVTVTHELVNTIDGCGDTDSQLYQFTATDASGNQSSCFATVSREDTTPPTIDSPATDMIVECDGNGNTDALIGWLGNHGGATVSDGCGSEITWSDNYISILSDGCGDTGAVTVTFTATDDCGNATTTMATFTIEDTMTPEISCPVDITLECSDPANDAIIVAWLGAANATDDCSNVSITDNYPDVFVGTCGSAGIYTVTFTATDDCGETSTCDATITIEDTIDPQFVLAPQDLIVECDGSGNTADINNWITINGNGSATDQCDMNLDWTAVAGSPVTDCGGASVTPYTFTITDDCGRTSTAIASVIIEDTTAPVISGPDDATMACNPANNPTQLDNLLGAFFATDVCDSPVVTTELYNSISGCGGTSAETYLITATDACGNASTRLFTFTIEDTDAPTLEQPDPLTLECGNPDNPSLINAWLDQFTGTDFCGGNVTVTSTWDGELVDGCGVNTLVSFNISDACGNNYDFNSTITLNDTADPYFINCPGDLTINTDVDECDGMPIFSIPVALDDCDNQVTVTQTGGPAPGEEFAVGTPIAVQFTAVDDCMNSVTCDFTITVIDADEPTILCPSNDVIACADAGTCTWVSSGLAPTTIENCDFDVTYSIAGATLANGVDDVSSTVFNLGTSIVTYTVTDANNNTSMCSFNVIVRDCEEPMITCPTDLSVECDGAGNMTELDDWLATVTATDNCDVTVTPTSRIFNSISACGQTTATVYEFIATDAAGNEERCIATFTIVDTTMPTIDTDAIDMTVECDDNGNTDALLGWLADNGGAVASDLCNPEITWTNNYTTLLSNDCGDTGEVEVVFTATDDCGNASTTAATFTIVDTTAPEIVCPTPIVLECSDPANDAIINAWLATATTTDDCSDITITNTYPDIFVGDCGDTGVYTVTFTAMDACANVNTCEATITIEDTTAPIITIGASDLYVDCTDDVAGQLEDWLAINGGAMGEDSCDDTPIWTNVAALPVDGCGTTMSTEYTFTLTDECGNLTTTSAIFGTTDTSAPALTPPDALTVECDGSGNLSDLATWLSSASATDDCELDLRVTNQLYNTLSGCGGESIAVYQFTVEDDCGNVSQDFAEFTIDDTTPPVITCPMTLELECGDPNNDQQIIQWLASGTATDLCSGVEVIADYPGTLPIACMGSVDVTFTATDECGNITTCVAAITMNDSTDPYFVNCPTAPLTINADVDVCGAFPIFSTPVALDECDVQAEVLQTGGLAPGTEFPIGVTTLEFTATDDCGNTAVCTYDIIVLDSDIPTILCPSNTVVACTDEMTCAWESVDIGPSTSIENCPYTITYEITGELIADGDDDASGEVFPLGLSEVCYTITDENGNTDTCCFDVLVEDCEAPQITCPTPMIVECDGAANTTDLTAWLATVSATDNCDATVTITNAVINTISGCGGTESLVYEFTAEDLAGNTTTCVETFTIEDTTLPSITTPAMDMTVVCDGIGNTDAIIGWLANNGGAVATDICSDLQWTNDYTTMVTDACAATGGLDVTFTATDACGNLSETTATFTIVDTVEPEITAPADLVLECGNGDNAAIISAWENDYMVFDVCDVNVTVVATTDVVPSCGMTSVTTYTFTATDACGNVDMDTATITIADTTPPVIDPLPVDLILECNDADNDLAIVAWLDANGGAMATDACGSVTWTNTEGEEEMTCGNTTTTPYTFIATDECGNVSTAVALIIIQDTTPPELAAPTDLVEECEAIGVGVTDWIAQATSSDLCGTPIITVELWNTISGCGNTLTETYLFTATDECGNTTTALADYGLEDTTVPAITTPAIDMVIECNGSDNVAQLLNWINNNGGAIARDGCGNLTWSNDYGMVDMGACEGQGSITVTFTVADECGNTSETSATLTIEDTEAPTFEVPASDLTLECRGDMDPLDAINSWLVNVGGADAEDDCSLISYTNDFVALEGGCSEFTGSALVTFTATDACGNSDVTTATVTVIDETPPMITRPSTDLTVECDGDGNIAALQAWLDANGDAEADDICSPFTWNIPILVSTIEGCGETVTYIYEFATTDDCGNESASTIASFIIEDTTSPTILPEAMNMTVECDGMGNEADLAAFLNGQGEALAMDDCGDLVWEFDLITIEETCSVTNIQTYRFTVADECGNVSTSEAIFTIEDTTAPAIVAGADMLMEECDPRGDNYPEFDFWLEDHAGATATDDCSQFTWRNDYHPDNWVIICGFSRFVDVTFTATDDCGNAESFTNRFGIGDVTPPEFTFCPPPVIVDAPAGWCSSYVNYSGPLAEDACGEITITQVDDTGLSTGDLFPVGLTILTYEAEDDCGNVSSCEIKIIVNDFHTPPTISCPIDTMTVTDPGVCGAVIDAIAPFDITDNCPDNLVVKYEIVQDGTIIADGFDDASGEFFPTGTSTVTYQAIDQPLILITEIIQDGVISGVEIGNIGPATVDVSCLNVVREGTTPESYNLANGTTIPVGGVITQDFTPIAVGSPAGYYISLVGRVIDGVSINGYSSTSYTFAGNLVGEDIYRIYVCDHDEADDFVVAESCFVGSYGTSNPDLAVTTDNGTTVGLQEGVPSIVECSFDVTIQDIEVPSCAMYDTLTSMTTLPQNIDGETCTMIDFIVSDDVNVGTVILSDLQVMIADAGALSGYLTSPSGTTVQLFGGMCSGMADIDVTFDQNAVDNLSTVLCDPLGNGLEYEPLESFKAYFNESSLGTWTLHLEKSSAGIAMLSNVELQILEHVPYAQVDVKLDNDLDQCGAAYTWDHPVFWDNCCEGGISVEYSSADDIVLPVNGDVIGGSTATEYFEVGTTLIVYTLVDQYGNQSQCSFEIEVCDVEDPVIAACPDVTLFLQNDDCTVPVSALPLPGFTDQCPGVDFAYEPPFEDGLVEGVHDICLVVTDASGNESKCTFEVTVLPNPNEVSGGQLSCIADVNLSLDADCMVTITADIMLTDEGYGCLDDFCVTLTDQWDNVIGTSADGTNIVTEAHIGQQIVVEICESCEEDSGNCCWGYLNVESKLIPDVVCPPDTIIECNMAFIPEITGMPEVMSCEQEIYFSYEDDYIEQTMCDDPVATIERTWTVTDESNNTITCVQTITITDFDLETVVYPDDIILTETYTCTEIEDDPTLLHPEHTGYPLLGGIPVYETGEGLCSHFWNWDDQILFNCEGSYEIIRTWLIRDMCDPIIPFVNPIEHYQSIKVLDSRPPIFEDCPEVITVNAGTHDCLQDIYLNDYLPSVSDACGTVKDTTITVTPGTVYQSPPGSGQYYLRNITTGSHTVKMKVKDQCSNFAECQFEIQVLDETIPNVICDFDINVSLSSSGLAKMYPESIDDGSFDACTDIYRQLYRMDADCVNGDDLVPGDFVTFCCEDVANSPVMVVMRVWDDADYDGVFGTAGDHFNECMVPINVFDKTIPDFQCPHDVILTCDEDYTNLAITGQPAVESVCSHLDATYVDDIGDLSDCNLGEITRTWTVTETGQTCVQTITLQSPDVVSEDDIVWPMDIEIDDECNILNLSPDDLPPANGYPSFADGQCSLLGMNHTDEIFEVSSGANTCYKIRRTWQVLNWCVTTDDGFEIYEHIQTIKVTNSIAPVIAGTCEDVIVETTSDDCSGGVVSLGHTATDDCTDAADLIWTYTIDFGIDGSEDEAGTTSTFNIEMPVGMHQVTWTVSDGCNNTDICTYLITVLDNTPPSPKCESGVIVTLVANVSENTETAELWAVDLDAGSDHPCGSSYTFGFSFSDDPTDDVMYFDCADIGTQAVQLWLTDANGNQAFCETTVIVQDNNGVEICDPSESMLARITGEMRTVTDVPVDSVEVTLINGDQFTLSDETGIFAFDEMPMGGSYQVVPYLDTNHRLGVSTLDIILIQRHILNLQPIESPYYLIAADANSSKSVTSSDMVAIRKLILEINDTFLDNSSWRFIDEAHQFVDPSYPWAPTLSETYQIPFLTHDMVTDFIAIKTGDVNGSYLSQAQSGESIARGQIAQVIRYEEMDSGEYILSTESDDLIYGLQMSIAVGPGFTELTSPLPEFSTDHYHYDGQILNISYHHVDGFDATASDYLFKVNTDGLSQLAISEGLDSESYHGDNLQVRELRLEQKDAVSVTEIAMSNHPNPWKDKTVISITSPQATDGVLRFYNSLGSLILTQEVSLAQGNTDLAIDQESLNTRGVITYTLEIGDQELQGKMLIIE